MIHGDGEVVELLVGIAIREIEGVLPQEGEVLLLYLSIAAEMKMVKMNRYKPLHYKPLLHLKTPISSPAPFLPLQ